MCSSSGTLPIGTLIEKINPIVMENDDLENRDLPCLIKFFPTSEQSSFRQNKKKSLSFLFGKLATNRKRLIGTMTE